MIDAQTKEALKEYQYSQKRIMELEAFVEQLDREIKKIGVIGESKEKLDLVVDKMVLIGEATDLIKFLRLRIEQRKPILRSLL